MASRAASFSAFVGEQIRKTKQRPVRLVLIPLTFARNVVPLHRIRQRIQEKTKRTIQLIDHWLSSRGTSTVPNLPTNPRRFDEAQSDADSRSSFGEWQANNCYLNRNPSPDFLELARRHAERRLDNFIFDPALLARQNVLLSKCLWNFFRDTRTFQRVQPEEIADCIAKYREAYLAAPITKNVYGLNFTGGLSLFVMAHFLNPKVIVESGTYKGLSAYILSSACPAATIHAFDTNLRDLSFRTPGVEYHECEWMTREISCDPVETGLCYFDDHQSQAMRVVQSYERGFRHLIFDDSWPTEAVIGCGWPPLPSIDMVLNSALSPGETITWAEGPQIWTYVQTQELAALCSRARSLIKAVYEVPSLYRQSGVAPSSALKFVELVR
jgi:hypothetical protein